VRHVLVALAVVLILVLLARSARRAPDVAPGGTIIIRYSWVTRGLALVFLLIFVAGAIVAATRGMKAPAWFGIPLMSALVGFSAFVALETQRFRVELGADEIRVWSGWRRSRVIPWAAVTKYEYSDWNRWYVLHYGERGKVRVSSYAVGADSVGHEAQRRGIRSPEGRI